MCEHIYFDILVDRLATRLEHFNPNKFVTMYLVDAMDGFQFEDFLVEVFQTMGYDVKETRERKIRGQISSSLDLVRIWLFRRKIILVL